MHGDVKHIPGHIQTLTYSPLHLGGHLVDAYNLMSVPICRLSKYIVQCALYKHCISLIFTIIGLV